MENKLFVVILNGAPESGKDTFVKLFRRLYENACYNYSAVERIKEVASMLGWKGQKDPKSRKFLSDLKDLWSAYNNGSFNYIVDRIQKEVMNWKSDISDTFVFIHCREPEEIKKFKLHYSKFKNVICKTLLIRRSIARNISNHADRNVENYPYDWVIINNGTIDEFKDHICYFRESI